MHKFKIEDRVILVSNTYPSSSENPRFSTKYECEGTIDNIADRSIHVRWDNLICNMYYSKDLKSVKPARYQSIW